MDEALYIYTLNSLRADSSSLESATATLTTMFSPDCDIMIKQALTDEMLKAFQELALSCQQYLTAYEEYAN